MSQPPTFVALCVATSGADPERDALLAVAAVRYVNGRPADTLAATVSPVVDTVPGTTSPTIDSPDLEGVPAPVALEAVDRFAGGDPLAAHDLRGIVRLARREGSTARLDGYDVSELARVVEPTWPDEGLAGLNARLRFGPVPAEMAERAERVGLLVLSLVDRAVDLEPRVRSAVAALAQRTAWPLAPLLRAVAASPGAGAGTSLPPLPAPLERAPRFATIDGPALEALVAPGGRMAETMFGFEDRAGQRQMLRSVCDAFNLGDQLLVEAGTGTGKSLAYLLPAAAWALANGRPVVVATHTIPLQDQLVGKDVPLVRRLLGRDDLEASVLKGRSNYLCRTRLAALASRDDLDPEEARTVARLLVWASRTTTGDRAELPLTPDESRLWRAASAEGDACTAETCVSAASGTCWLQRARARAAASHLIVTNHALAVSDAIVQNRVLPRHAHLIVDEAHHLEAVATDALGFSARRQRARDAAAGTALAGERGLLARAAAAVSASDLDAGTRTALWQSCVALRGLALRAGDRADRLYDALAAALGDRGAADVRITDAVRARPEWTQVEAALEAAQERFGELRSGVARLAQALAAAGDLVAGGEALVPDLSSAARELAEVAAGLERVISRPDANDVSWVSGEGDRLSVHLAPLEVGEVLSRWLFEDKETLVLTSATLRAGDDFAFLRSRLALPDAPSLAIGSPFDYGASALVFVPTDMPAPGEPGYQEALDAALVELAATLGGRVMVLYTSHGGLRDSYHRIRTPLGTFGVTVLGQGLDGPQQLLLEGLRDPLRRTLLLGTRSFWEGVDVPGQALSCVAMARLPFDVPTDPVFAARAETFDDPFREYAVPQAVLRFRQGFGRLIRSRSDRGVFAVLDSRIRSRTYGHTFLSALPGCRVYRGRLAQLAPVSRRFLDGEPVEEAVGVAPAGQQSRGDDQ